MSQTKQQRMKEPGKNTMNGDGAKSNDNKEERATHNASNPRCACGCIPMIPGLFEMAQMRQEAREKKEAEAGAK